MNEGYTLVANFLSETQEPKSVIHSMKRKTISYSFHYDIRYIMQRSEKPNKYRNKALQLKRRSVLHNM